MKNDHVAVFLFSFMCVFSFHVRFSRAVRICVHLSATRFWNAVTPNWAPSAATRLICSTSWWRATSTTLDANPSSAHTCRWKNDTFIVWRWSHSVWICLDYFMESSQIRWRQHVMISKGCHVVIVCDTSGGDWCQSADRWCHRNRRDEIPAVAVSHQQLCQQWQNYQS